MRISVVLLSAILFMTLGCAENNEQSAPGSSEQGSGPENERPPKPVNVIIMKSQQIAMSNELPGRVTASKTAEIRPQVSGIIQSRLYKEGSLVEQGQQLYQIDPAIFEADHQSAKAGLQNAQAKLGISKALQTRYESLIETNAISEQEFDKAKADVAQAQAEVALAQAKVKTADINLGYTKVNAPISGYIGPSTVTIGALVTAQQVEALATIRQLDPIYVDLSQPATDAQHLQERLMSSRADKAQNAQFEVNILLDSAGTTYPQKGVMYATDLAVDENTGTIRLRSVFPNPDGALLPGMFVRATIDEAGVQKTIIVPQKAVSIEADGSKSVWTVDENNTANKRKVVTSTTYKNNWVIQSGLNEGDTVIVEGMMMLKPGVKVSPTNMNKQQGNDSVESSTANETNTKGQSQNTKEARLMISSFFINRPIFAWVIAIVIMGLGALSISSLPIEQYPNIAAPKISISATYPGASAQTLENTVTQVIEQNLTGIDNLRYIQSDSSSSGRTNITLTFEPGTDANIAQVQTQNKVSQAQSSLPQAVQRQGVFVRKAGSSYALIVSFYATDDSLNRNEISDFLASNLEEPLSRVNGVGQIRTFGPEHAMRIWLNPQAMYNFNVTTQDVLNAVREQNVQLASGQIGGAPSVEGQQLNATITSQSLLETVEEFEQILLTVVQDGSQVTLGDVARVEIGAQSYSVISRYNRRPASGIAIELAPDANALQTIQAVKDRIAEFDDIIPDSLKIAYPVDVSPFVEASIYEVVKTLLIAVLLVIAVIYIFLQSPRATLIPSVAIPVVLLGTFAFLYLFDYSINVLTLFALVLAIGMLVDDAIVVTENIENKLENDSDLNPKEASIKAMKEISGALIGTTAVIWAVFIPITFFEGSTGVIYRQFAVTISAAMGISLFVALSLSPSLCALILQQGKAEKDTGFFGLFNRGFKKLKSGHATLLEKLLKNRFILPLVFLVLIAVSAVLFIRIPTSFLPDEDQGRLITIVSGPVSSTLQQTVQKNEEVENFYLDQTNGAVEGIFTAAGFSFAGNSQNVGISFIKMKDWSERDAEASVFNISKKAGGALAQVKDAMIIPIVPPAVTALGNSSGFEFQLVDRAGLGQEALSGAMNKFLAQANQSGLLNAVRFNGLAPSPQYNLDIDSGKARAMGVPMAEINQTLSTALGGSYINDFIEDGRIKRVYAQADAPYRMLPEDINRWYVRNGSGDMVSLSEFGAGEWTFGAPKLTRFDGNSSVEIQGEAAQGISSGEALEEVSKLAQSLPDGIDLQWTGLSYEEKQSGGQAWIVYMICIIAVFLALAALYESWTVPLAIMLTVPLGIFGAVLATWWADQANDVYFQVGLLMTIALAAKNAILIIEFAKTSYEEGMDAYDAAVKAAKQRLRPILMTSLTFILGVMPLAFAAGPGSGAQNAISIGVLGGIMATTLLVVFFAPFFFMWAMRVFDGKNKENKEKDA